MRQKQPKAVKKRLRSRLLPKESPKRFRLRKNVAVHPHASGAWTTVIGKRLNADATALVPKQFYFQGTEADAIANAQQLLPKWTFIFRHWAKFQSTLRLVGSKFADEPHWEAALGKEPTAEDIEADAKQADPLTREEMAKQFENMLLTGVAILYIQQRQISVAHGDVRPVTVDAEAKNIRGAMRFFPTNLRMANLTLEEISEAKTKMLAAVSRRTAKNYLLTMKAMLKWFYDGSEYGRSHEKPINFDRIFGVANANRTDVRPASAATLKETLAKINSDRTRLYVMLALNCGMYQADIAKLDPSEVNVDAGYIFWDRSKEPTNPFRVCHTLWPETLRLVKQFLQADGPHAFLTKAGKPLTNAIHGTWNEVRKTNPDAPQFHELRKSTNQALLDLLHGETNNLEAVAEISKQFLGQKTPMLSRVYATSGMKTYDRMNHRLKAVGDVFRAAGVFGSLQAQNDAQRESMAVPAIDSGG